MWIEIKKDIFEKADFKTINFIIQIITWYPSGSIPRYQLLLNPRNSTIRNSNNWRQLPNIDKELIQRKFENAVMSQSITKGQYIITSKQSRKANEFNIEEAIRFLLSPVSIVLENSLNDRYFMEAIFYCFGKKINGKNKLLEFVNNGWIQFVNAGGCGNIKNYYKGVLKTYEKLASMNGKNTWDYLKCFVLIDSDKIHPEATIDQARLKEDLETEGVQVHILEKRAMENYMPDEVILQIPHEQADFKKSQDWVNVYINLTNEQKDFLNYKNGFSSDADNQGLYDDLSAQNAQILNNGLKLPKFKNYFPSLFGSFLGIHVNRTSLLNREGGTAEDNEFLIILEKINQLL